MATVDVRSQVSAVASIRPQAVTAPVNGAGVDLAGFEGALILVELGTFAGTAPTATIQVQESDDDATFSPVAAEDLDGALPATIDPTNDETVYELNYKGRRRYIRVAVTAVGGTSPSLPMSAVVIRTNARKQPV